MLGVAEETRRPRRLPPRRTPVLFPPLPDPVGWWTDPKTRTGPAAAGPFPQSVSEEPDPSVPCPFRFPFRSPRRPSTAARTAAGPSCRPPPPTTAFPAACPPEVRRPQWPWPSSTAAWPFYLQPQSRDRAACLCARATLSDWMGRTAWWLKPLWELLLGSVLSSPKLFCDDTRLPVLAPGKGKTSTVIPGASAGVATPGQAAWPPPTFSPGARSGTRARGWRPASPACPQSAAGAASSG